MEPTPMTTLDRSEFGPNEWLIDEMYRRFREDPDSVGAAWREFFEDYVPRGDGRVPADGQRREAPATTQPAEAAAPAQPAEQPEPAPAPEDAEVVALRGAAGIIAE